MRAALALVVPLTLFLPLTPAQLRAELERLPRDQAAPMVMGLLALGEHRTLPAPGEGKPCGLAWFRDTLWLLRDRSLLRVDPKTGAALETLPADGWVSLAADQRFLFAATETGEVVVIDPLAGRPVRTIPPARQIEEPIRAITVLGDRMLLADAAGRVLELSADRKRATPFWRHPGWTEPVWIGADHDHLVFCRDGFVNWVHGKYGDVLRRAAGLGHSLAGAVRDGELWLLCPTPKGDEFFVLTPYREVDCIAVRLIGTGGPGIGKPGAPPDEVTHWIVGRQRANDGVRLTEILRDAKAADRRSETIDGGRVVMPFVLQVEPGATIGDVITSIDAAEAAGIDLRTPGLSGLTKRDR